MSEWGDFPFGRPNTVRPARIAAESDAVVIGVYPSAWHVAWTAPAKLASADRKGGVTALAVDVEPTVFWDGKADDFGERLARWKKEVGFVEGKHGVISLASPSTNGSSGEKVVQHYLKHRGLDPARVSFTDVYPVFMVKMPKGKKREQGGAISIEYDSIALQMDAPPSSLPARISPAKLPKLAAPRFGQQLAADLVAAAAPLVITLGEEVGDTLVAVPSLRARPPCGRFTDLYGPAYGSVGSVTINGRETEWLPLVHPGLLKGDLDPDADIVPGRRTGPGWGTLHARWEAAARKWLYQAVEP